MKIALKSNVELDCVIEGTVSDTENADNVKAYINVEINGGSVTIEITSLLDERAIQSFKTALEDEYRNIKEAFADFGDSRKEKL